MISQVLLNEGTLWFPDLSYRMEAPDDRRIVAPSPPDTLYTQTTDKCLGELSMVLQSRGRRKEDKTATAQKSSLPQESHTSQSLKRPNK